MRPEGKAPTFPDARVGRLARRLPAKGEPPCRSEGSRVAAPSSCRPPSSWPRPRPGRPSSPIPTPSTSGAPPPSISREPSGAPCTSSRTPPASRSSTTTPTVRAGPCGRTCKARPPVEYLARLAIRDGEIPKGSRRCASPGASAFTAGGAAVFVCSTNFRTQPRGLRENAFIHEMLHTLGLRENPPSSAEITRRVTRALRELKGLDSTRCRAAWPGVSSSPPPSGESSLPARRPRPGSGRRFRA
jgi:hypothetical protein